MIYGKNFQEAWVGDVKIPDHLFFMTPVLDVGRKDIGEMNAHTKGIVLLRHH